MTARPASTWLLLALALLAWFGTLGWRDLITPDEGRYAEIGRQMLMSGDWITPRLNGILYFEKPVLQYWATAAAFQLFGFNEFAARWWPGLTGGFAVLALWWTARRVQGVTVATYGACVLGSCLWWLGNSHFLSLDMGLSASLTLAMLGFWYGQRDEASERDNRLGMRVAWVAMAFAVLSKGLIGIVLPGAVLVVYSLVARDVGVWRRMHWGSGLVLFALITVPWFVAVSLRNPEFARFFFIHEHLERFLTTSHRRTGAWWYFVPFLLAGLLPWTSLAPGALAASWQRVPGRFQGNRFLLTWAVVIFAFFSASGSKLPSYILPIFPALALLIAQHLNHLPARRFAWHCAAIAALMVVAGLGLTAATLGWLGEVRDFTVAQLHYRDWIVAGFALLAALALAATRLAFQQHQTAATVAMAFAGLLGTQTILLGHQTLAAEKSARALAAALAPQLPPDAPVFSVSYYDQTLPFYLRRPVTLVNWVDEFATGLRIEPHRGVATEAEFAARWRTLPQAAAVMRLDTYARWRDAGLPVREVYRDAVRVAVVRASP